MRKLALICGTLGLFAGLALAESFSGKLLDSSCYDQQKTAKSCDATASTTQFALDVSGKIYKLDAGGNAKAVEAMKNHAERSADPNQRAVGSVNARVSGEKEGDESIKVDTIEIQ